MKNIALEMVNAQRSKNFALEAKLLKKFADITHPIRSVNEKSALSMPGRFLSKLVFGANECWYWRGHVDAIGYGRFQYKGENKAHRVSYLIFKGEIPNGMKVLHKCDNRQCVNPDHLFIGSQADNVADMIAKGRNKTNPLYGSANPMSKANDEIVQAIREEVAAGAKQIDMAKKYGLSAMTISRIVRKETWK